MSKRSEAAQKYRAMYRTPRWSRMRKLQLATHPICQMDNRNAATVVDHIIPHRGDPELFYDLTNLQSLCKHCHDSHKQKLEVRGYHSDVDETGWPSDDRHPANKRIK